MELKKYSESIRVAIAGCGHLPLFIVLQTFYYVNYPLFLKMVVFPDTNWYQALFVAFREGLGVPAWLHAPFKQRVMFSHITAIFYNLTYPILPMSEEWYFFAVNSIIMIGVNICLYLLFKHYTTGNWAVFGVWVHNLSYPVVWYFLAGLTDALGYLFVLVGLLIIKSYKEDDEFLSLYRKDMFYLLSLLVGVFVRESILITLPIWIYIKIKLKPIEWERDNYSRSDKIVSVIADTSSIVLIMIVTFVYYGIDNKTHFNLPPSSWLLVTFLCLVPFVPFIPKWKMNTQDKLYSIIVILYSVYALFFAFYDGRFLVLGYPIWVGYSLKAINRLIDWLRNELELMNKDNKVGELC